MITGMGIFTGPIDADKSTTANNNIANPNIIALLYFLTYPSFFLLQVS
jgi:poly-beta-hydroxyalkanoate depolymerase